MNFRLGSALLLASVACAAHGEAPFSFDATPGRLPKTVVPENYVIRIAPDLAKMSFEGNAAIRIEVRKPVRKIVLDALELEIDAATLTGAGSAPQRLTAKLDAEAQTLTLSLASTLAPGPYQLDIAYRGKLNTQTQGLYVGRYNTAAGEKVMLSSQMEPSDARRMLPCWDEPAFRATFQVSVDLPASQKAYSNTPVEKTESLPDARRRTTFQRTPKMASYLLVLVAGELEELSGTQDGVNINIVTVDGRRRTADYALAASRALLHYYNDYFGVAYPLPKLDQLAVPSTQGFSAMENWGGITYDEAVLLFDEHSSAPGTRRDVYFVVAHEMAHQWFGDLVTMGWWDNIWLNEGFAEWMGVKATDHLNPDWNGWQRANDLRERAMALDARLTTHPIQQPVKDDRQATDAFDSITYRKGMGFLRMLENWLGPDTFRDGLRAYMKQHQYSNATTADLWSALEQVSGKPVRHMAAGWVTRPGFPVIKVSARCESGTRRIELSQERFTVDNAPGGAPWNVPVAVAAGGTAAVELLDQRTKQLTRPGCDGPVIADPDAVGYFRVEYAPDLLAALTQGWRSLGSATRLKVLSDTWALAGIGRVPLSGYLALLDQARNDTEPAIWNEILNRVDKLDALSLGEPVQRELRAFGIDLLKPRLEGLGWDPRKDDSQETLELRPRLIATLGRLGDSGVRKEAAARFKRFLKSPSSLAPSLVDPVTEIAGRFADEATYTVLAERARTAVGSEEQSRYVGALSGVLDPALAQRALQLTLGTTLAAPLATRIPVGVAEEHPGLAWGFAKEHADEIRARLASYQLNSYFGGILSGVADVQLADDLEGWTRAHLPPSARTVTHRLADGIRFNAKLKGRLLPQLEAALSAPQRSADGR